MEVCLDTWRRHHILCFLWRFQLNHRCGCVSRTYLSVPSRARALKTASLWFSFEVMPGMVVLISACRVSGGQLFGFNFSQRCASVVRMSACSFCCSFIRWFNFPFSLCFCGVFELLVQGVVWHPLHLFYVDEKCDLSSALKWFNSSSFLHFSCGSGRVGARAR